jgi:hypothetical protein
MPTETGNCGGVVTSDHPSGGTFPVGTTNVTLTDTRLDGSTATCTFTVTVNDTEFPVVSAATVDTPTLWSPNHQMVPITVNYTATDNCSVNCVLTVTSNEPINGLGDGDTAPDWQIIDAHHLLLRSERSGKGGGRVYTITVTCTDPSGCAYGSSKRAAESEVKPGPGPKASTGDGSKDRRPFSLSNDRAGPRNDLEDVRNVSPSTVAAEKRAA